MTETVSTTSVAIRWSRSNRRVQRGYPSGGAEQAMRVTSASKRPSNLTARGGVSRSFRSRAASRPSSTKRCFMRSRVRTEKPTAVETSETFHRSSANSPTSSSSNALANRTLRAVCEPLLAMAFSSFRSSWARVILYVAGLPICVLLPGGFQENMPHEEYFRQVKLYAVLGPKQGTVVCKIGMLLLQSPCSHARQKVPA